MVIQNSPTNISQIMQQSKYKAMKVYGGAQQSNLNSQRNRPYQKRSKGLYRSIDISNMPVEANTQSNINSKETTMVAK